MSSFIKQLIMKKLNDITLNDLLYYSHQYGFILNKTEAEQIVTYLKNNKLDPFDQDNHEKLFQDLARITNHETAMKAQKFLNEIIRSYGLDHLFN